MRRCPGPIALALLLAAACSSGAKPQTSGPHAGSAGQGAAGTGGGAAGTIGAAGTGDAAGTSGAAGIGGEAAGTTGTAGTGDAAGTTGAAGTGAAGTGAAGTGAAGTGAKRALNYQLTGTWPALKAAFVTKAGALTFNKIKVHDRYLAESCSIADYNDDGKPDISSGRRWYEGPDFKVEHVFRDGHDDLPRDGATAEIGSGASDDMADFAWDVDGDGWTDIINVAPPDVSMVTVSAPPERANAQLSATAYWFKNPGASATGDPKWMKFLVHGDVRGEHRGLADVDGDGRPEIFGACKSCTPRETKGYYQADPTDPKKEWIFHTVTRMYNFPFNGTGKLHGFGMGDVDGDGHTDFLERGGVWLQQPGLTWNQTVCPGAGCGWIQTSLYDGAPADNRGGSHMFAADFDGDGDADIFSADFAHGWGLAWYEQKAGPTFVRHQFLGMNTPEDAAKFGMSGFSEPHSAQVVDMDGDGIPDIVTGKMHFAQPPSYGDPDPNGAPVSFIFKTVRKPDASGSPVTFEPHKLDDTVGVGTQLAVGHANTDGILDLCVATKLGLAVYLGQ